MTPPSSRFAVTAEIIAAITSSLVPEEVLATVAERIADVFGVWECGIYEYREADGLAIAQALWTQAPHPGDADWVGSAPAPDEQPMLYQALRERRTIEAQIDDPRIEPGERAAMEYWGERSCLYMPLIFKEQVIGCLELVEKRATRHFGRDERELAEPLAALAAVAIENARLYAGLKEVAISDGLTDLYNHRYFYDRLAEEVARAQRYELPLSLLMLDVDDFKRFNDAYGHRAGDAVLRDLAALLKDQTRHKVDLVARYGGEEFAVILPGTGGGGGGTGEPAAAVQVAERIRGAVAAASLGPPGISAPMTVSVGVASFPADAASMNGLFEAADRALYRAKERGKNRVEVAVETAPA